MGGRSFGLIAGRSMFSVDCILGKDAVLESLAESRLADIVDFGQLPLCEAAIPQEAACTGRFHWALRRLAGD